MYIFFQTIQSLETLPRVIQLWQLKLLFSLVVTHPTKKSLIPSEIALSMKQRTIEIIERWENELHSFLKLYVMGNTPHLSSTNQFRLASFVTFFDIPFGINVRHNENYLELFLELQTQELSAGSLDKILNIITK